MSIKISVVEKRVVETINQYNIDEYYINKSYGSIERFLLTEIISNKFNINIGRNKLNFLLIFNFLISFAVFKMADLSLK